MSAPDSYVWIPAAKVRQFAATTIREIRAERKRSVAAAIEARRQTMTKRLATRVACWFGRPAPTSEDAERDFGRDRWPYNTSLSFARYYAEENYSVAWRLLTAAQHADEIRLSTQDLYRIAPVASLPETDASTETKP